MKKVPRPLRGRTLDGGHPRRLLGRWGQRWGPELGVSGHCLTGTPAATQPVAKNRVGYNAQLPTLDPAHSVSRGASQVIGNLCDSL